MALALRGRGNRRRDCRLPPRDACRHVDPAPVQDHVEPESGHPLGEDRLPAVPRRGHDDQHGAHVRRGHCNRDRLRSKSPAFAQHGSRHHHGGDGLAAAFHRIPQSSGARHAFAPYGEPYRRAGGFHLPRHPLGAWRVYRHDLLLRLDEAPRPRRRCAQALAYRFHAHRRNPDRFSHDPAPGGGARPCARFGRS